MPRRKKVADETPKNIGDELIDDIVFGGEEPHLEKVVTGLWSFDNALGGGLPLRTPCEIYGQEKVGKSTFMYYLAGCIGTYYHIYYEGNVELGIADLEGYDPDYVITRMRPSGFKGIIQPAPLTVKDKPASHEQKLDWLLEYLKNDQTAAIMLDSVGAVFSKAEAEEESLDEAHVGIRARLMSKVMRKGVNNLRNKTHPAAFFLTNHIHQIIGGRGSATVGGKAIHYLSGMRIRMWNESKYNQDDGSYAISGTLEDYKFGKSRGAFKVFVKAGVGVHPGITSVIDCIDAGLVSGDRVIKLGDRSYGYLKTLIMDKYDDPDVFTAFTNELYNK